MKHCSSCGFENPDNAKFCVHCGASLAASAEKPTPPSQPKPSPYASLPYNPDLARKNTPKKELFPFRARMILAGCILLVALISGIIAARNANPFQTPSKPQPSSVVAAEPSPTYTPAPTPTPSCEPEYTYQLTYVEIKRSDTAGKYYIDGRISIFSDTNFKSATLTVKVYAGDVFLTQEHNQVYIACNQIYFSIPVYLSESDALRADYARVELAYLKYY